MKLYLYEYIAGVGRRQLLLALGRKNPAKDVSRSGSTRYSGVDGLRDLWTFDATVHYPIEDDDIKILSPL